LNELGLALSGTKDAPVGNDHDDRREPERYGARHDSCGTVTDKYMTVLKKGKVFPYSLPSVGPGADPGVQAVSPQVT